MAINVIILLRTSFVSSIRPKMIPPNTPTTDVTDVSVVSSACPTPSTSMVDNAQAGNTIRLNVIIAINNVKNATIPIARPESFCSFPINTPLYP